MFRTLISATPVLLLMLLPCRADAQIEKSDLHIGLLMDFAAHSIDSENRLADFKEEIQRVVGIEKSVHFRPDHLRFSAESADYHSLVSDPMVDLIIAVGPASTGFLTAREDFPKPTIAVGILDVDLQQIPITEPGVSGVENFTYILNSHPIQKDLEALRRIYPFRNLAVVVSGYLEGKLGLEDYFGHIVSAYEAEVKIVYWDSEETVPALGDEIDAVYLAMALGRTSEEVSQLADVLIDRKLPSFAPSRNFVDMGIMACIGNENGSDLIIRNLALIVEAVVLGEDLSALPVRRSLDNQWVLNSATVRRIGLDLPFETLFSARFLQVDESEADRRLSLREVIVEGLKTNLDLRIEKRNLDLASQDIRLARSTLLPAVDATTTFLQIDSDAAQRARGQQPERTFTGTGTVQQVLFSEPAFANLEIQRYLAEAARHRTDLVALDVVLSLATSYFDILHARTGARIQDENLEVSRRNLKIARTRNAVGYAGIADVFRWESEVARATQASIEAFNNVYLAKVQLNRLLNRSDIGEEFEVKDVQLSDELFGLFDPARIGPLIERAGDVDILTDFLVEEALQNMPSLKQLQANINAAERRQRMNRRMYYFPTVALRGQADYPFWRGGKGIPPASSEGGRGAWNLALNFSYPLFQGNQRKIEIDRTAIQQQQLRLQEESLRQQLSQAVRVRMTNLVSRRTNIAFADEAATSAGKNFELVQDAYQKGQLEIAQLVDAQRAAFAARQAEAAAIYDYLVSYLQLENSIGAYTMFMTSGEQESFVRRLTGFFSKRKNPQ